MSDGDEEPTDADADTPADADAPDEEAPTDADADAPEDADASEGEESAEAEERSEDEADEEGAEAEEADEEADEAADEEADEAADEDQAEEDAGESPAYDLDRETFEERLDDAEAAIEDAETETDLDECEAKLDAIEADLDEAEFPEPDEDEEDPREVLGTRLEDARADLEDARGPYAEDAITDLEAAQADIEEGEWTERGEGEVRDAVNEALASVGDALDETFETVDDDADPEAAAAALDAPAAAISDADLDADEDDETIAALVEATEGLLAAIEDSQEWDDLTTREKLQIQGFYDALGEKHKDYPPEWSALKEWEKRDNAEMVLLALDSMDSDFMERHCLEALERMGNPAAVEPMLERAEKRDKPAIRILGKVGDERAVETLNEFTDGDVGLQRVTLRALGEIGSEESTQAVADQLVAEDASVRSHAARALGMIGDTRAVAPLADALENDEADNVRASAAWALVQIGTEDALEAAAEYADDRAYIVSAEAEAAARALEDDAVPA